MTQAPIADPHASSGRRSGGAEPEIELSVVMPCLNEADTLERCIEKARAAIKRAGVRAEIIVSDNGSTDDSPQIARRLGVRLVEGSSPGYGSALMAGIAASQGRYVIMGDADDSYDFGEIPRFLEKLREGYALVQGCRLPSGGGTVLPGAMPTTHRWIGNPLFTGLVRWWFGAPIHDVNCGMRGFSRELYDRIDQRCLGMEFANEMVIKASLFGERIAEIPITLHPDGRVHHGPHLRTVRDGWRTLRFYLLYCPRWLFFIPGVTLMLLGAVGFALAMPRVTVFGAQLDVHTLLFAALFVLVGQQAIHLGLFARTFAVEEGLLPGSPRLDRFLRAVDLERGLLAGSLLLLLGTFLLLGAVNQWRAVAFGDLDYERTMRWVIPGTMFVLLGLNTMLASFLLSLLAMRRR